MHHRESTSYNPEDLLFENELTKLKLRATYGITLVDSPTDSPEQEHVWLEQLADFEQIYADDNQVAVFVYIGEPAHFRAVEKLSRFAVKKELQQLKAHLNDFGIRVKSLCEVDDREMYRFVTEEIFLAEIAKERDPKHIKTFLYEAYYPNQAFEIKTTIEEMFQRMFLHLWSMVEGHLAERVQTTRKTAISNAQLIGKLVKWVNMYEDIQLTDISFSKITVKHKQAAAAACISFEALLPDTYELFNGQLNVNFQLSASQASIWQVSGLYIPELQL